MPAGAGNGGGIGQGDVYSNGITISGTTYSKTSEVFIVPTGTTATIAGSDTNVPTGYEGVFKKNRIVILSPFVMSQYEVTQQLYFAVMGTNPSECNSATGGNYPLLSAESELQKYRPVENVSWYDAVVFCNELTKKTMTESDCVYTITGITKVSGSITEATVTSDITKKGYRLPTEAEWEYAARGGDPKASIWAYLYAGNQTKKQLDNFTIPPYTDAALDAVGWYMYNLGGGDSNSTELTSGAAGYGTHAVGQKNPNVLGLYDMSGNVIEWCWDWAGTIASGEQTDPQGATLGTYRVSKGGGWGSKSYICSVATLSCTIPSLVNEEIGIRLVRTL